MKGEKDMNNFIFLITIALMLSCVISVGSIAVSWVLNEQTMWSLDWDWTKGAQYDELHKATEQIYYSTKRTLIISIFQTSMLYLALFSMAYCLSKVRTSETEKKKTSL